MAYTKQNWECGDLITADKMNHIEDGIEDASSGGDTEPLIIRLSYLDPSVTYGEGWHFDRVSLTGVVIDKTYSEIAEAVNAKRDCYMLDTNGRRHTLVSEGNSAYKFHCIGTAYAVINAQEVWRCDEYVIEVLSEDAVSGTRSTAYYAHRQAD